MQLRFWQFPRGIVSVHCLEEGCIGKYIPRGPRDFPRGAKSPPEGNLEGGGDGFPNTSRVLVEHGHSLIITREGLMKILPLGIGLVNTASRDRIGQYYPAGRDGHQIHPCRVELIDSVNFNPSLVMMREWSMISYVICRKSWPQHWEPALFITNYSVLADCSHIRFISIIHKRPESSKYVWFSLASQPQSSQHVVYCIVYVIWLLPDL